MKSYWQKCSEDTIFEMGKIEVSIKLMRTSVFPISRLPRHLKRLFCTIYNTQDQEKFRKKQYFYSRIKICGLIYKRVTLYHIMTKLHSISTKVIPIHTFVNVFANFNPRIHILSFLDSAQAGVLKTAQNLFLKCLGSRENVKTKVCIKLLGTS